MTRADGAHELPMWRLHYLQGCRYRTAWLPECRTSLLEPTVDTHRGDLLREAGCLIGLHFSSIPSTDDGARAILQRSWSHLA